jgi:hypothetical protein
MRAGRPDMRQLVPCPGCARHVRLAEPACPFCGDSSVRIAPVRKAPLGRSRAAILGATLATTAAASGCYEDHGRFRDAAVTTADAGEDAAFIAAYGTPVDASLAAPPDAHEDDDAGAPIAEYGGPPVFDDAGVDAGHGDPGADYGGPPSE